jgi:hypothetical protein
VDHARSARATPHPCPKGVYTNDFLTVTETENLPGVERVLAARGDEYRELQLALDKMQRVAWIQGLAPWQVMATFTFRWEAGIYSAQRCYEKTMARRLPGVSYVEAIERNPSRDGYHVHAVWADCTGVSRKGEWENWFKRYGRARIEPVRSEHDVSGYASKYLCKDDSWFNVKLQWHRLQSIRGAHFTLGAVGRAPASCPVRA